MALKLLIFRGLSIKIFRVFLFLLTLNPLLNASAENSCLTLTKNILSYHHKQVNRKVTTKEVIDTIRKEALFGLRLKKKKVNPQDFQKTIAELARHTGFQEGTLDHKLADKDKFSITYPYPINDGFNNQLDYRLTLTYKRKNLINSPAQGVIEKFNAEAYISQIHITTNEGKVISVKKFKDKNSKKVFKKITSKTLIIPSNKSSFKTAVLITEASKSIKKKIFKESSLLQDPNINQLDLLNHSQIKTLVDKEIQDIIVDQETAIAYYLPPQVVSGYLNFMDRFLYSVSRNSSVERQRRSLAILQEINSVEDYLKIMKKLKIANVLSYIKERNIRSLPTAGVGLASGVISSFVILYLTGEDENDMTDPEDIKFFILDSTESPIFHNFKIIDVSLEVIDDSLILYPKNESTVKALEQNQAQETIELSVRNNNDEYITYLFKKISSNGSTALKLISRK